MKQDVQRHTPGPWEADGERISAKVPGGSVGVAYAFSEVDAHLIAAAPDMRKALEDLMAAYIELLYDETGKPADHTPEILAARAALAKAGVEQ